MGRKRKRNADRDVLVHQGSRCYLLLESCEEGDTLPLLERLEGFESTTESLTGMMKEVRVVVIASVWQVDHRERWSFVFQVVWF